MGMVCELAAATFATTLNRSRDVAVLAVSFVLSATWLRPDPEWIGAGVVSLALVHVRWSVRGWGIAIAAGVLAGLWGHVLQRYGVAAWVALPIAAALPIGSVFMARRSPAFAPAGLREDVMLWVGVLAVVLAAGPAVSLGWRTASALNLESGYTARSEIGPRLTLGLGAVASLGALHSWWRRR